MNPDGSWAAAVGHAGRAREYYLRHDRATQPTLAATHRETATAVQSQQKPAGKTVSSPPAAKRYSPIWETMALVRLD